jgi:hypothetical protein
MAHRLLGFGLDYCNIDRIVDRRYEVTRNTRKCSQVIGYASRQRNDGIRPGVQATQSWQLYSTFDALIPTPFFVLNALGEHIGLSNHNPRRNPCNFPCNQHYQIALRQSRQKSNRLLATQVGGKSRENTHRSSRSQFDNPHIGWDIGKIWTFRYIQHHIHTEISIGEAFGQIHHYTFSAATAKAAKEQRNTPLALREILRNPT